MLRSLIRRLAVRVWPWVLLLLAWAAILYLLSSRSTLPSGPEIPYKDKVLHFLYFSGGGFLIALILRQGRSTLPGAGWRWWLAGTFFGMLAGALDEYHQTFTPGRSGNDLGDWIADVTGAGTGALLAWGFLRWAFRRSASGSPQPPR